MSDFDRRLLTTGQRATELRKKQVPHPDQTSKTKGLFLDKVPKNLCFWLALPKALFSWVDAIKLSILANASCQKRSKRRIAIDLHKQPNEPNINTVHHYTIHLGHISHRADCNGMNMHEAELLHVSN